MTFVQRKFYLPEETYTKLSFVAKASGKTITQVLRELLEEGLVNMQKKNKKSLAKVLLGISAKAEKEGWKGPKDLSENHDKYFVEQSK